MHVEVKAHCDELEKECKGKHLATNASKNSIMNHEQIGSAISQAKIEISKTISSIAISRDNCYQLSNRIAYAWWLANQVVPVVLIYLGFLNCEEMNYGNNRLFHSDIDW
ncbi:hypothetical protein [Flavobacterium sp. SM2513]|uniref:hypothetical protein n=1 Tax=Flavobacterium sp. SM2513 TaxID=3424766 RepID=UPI003D7F9CFB